MLEKASSPTSDPVLPQLLELLFQNVGGVKPFVRAQQHLQGLSSLERKVALVRQQRVAVPFDEATVLALQTGIFVPADLVHRLLQMSHHVKLVVQDFRLRGVADLERRVPKRLPHIHDRQANSLQSPCNLVCRLLLEKKKKKNKEGTRITNHHYCDRASDSDMQS